MSIPNKPSLFSMFRADCLFSRELSTTAPLTFVFADTFVFIFAVAAALIVPSSSILFSILVVAVALNVPTSELSVLFSLIVSILSELISSFVFEISAPVILLSSLPALIFSASCAFASNKAKTQF